MKLCLAIILNLVIIASLFSQDSNPLITDRPDQTESSNTVGKNVLQIESGTLLETGIEVNAWTLNTNLFRYGISNNFELRLNTDLIRAKNKLSDLSDTGLGDIQLGFKYQFLRGKVEGAWLSHTYIPTGSVAFEGVWGTSNKLLLQHDVSDRMSFGYNVGYEYFEGDLQNFTYTYAIGFSLTEKVGFFTEIYGDWVEFDEFFLNYDNGFTYLINDNLQLDLSLGFGLNHDLGDFYSAGVSWRIPK